MCEAGGDLRCRKGPQSRKALGVRYHKPHVHVKYNDSEAVVALDGEMLSGSLPVKQHRILDGWLALHEEEAYAAWNLAVQGKHFEKIVSGI